MSFYFQGYRILSILLPGIWDTWFNISVTSRDIENLGKLIMEIFADIRDICLFTSKDMGYLVLPTQASDQDRQNVGPDLDPNRLAL